MNRQHIELPDRQTIGALLRRIEAARRFPDNTDPCVRHVEIMGETLGAGLPYPMLDEERGHCAISLLSVVADLYEARNDAAKASPGFALVPVEPTPAMFAAHAPEDERPGDFGTMKYRRGIWKAMLKAAAEGGPA